MAKRRRASILPGVNDEDLLRFDRLDRQALDIHLVVVVDLDAEVLASRCITERKSPGADHAQIRSQRCEPAVNVFLKPRFSSAEVNVAVDVL